MNRNVTVILGILCMLFLIECSAEETNEQSIEPTPTVEVAETLAPSPEQQESTRQIKIITETEDVIIFALNDSNAATYLYDQLPLTIEISDYSNDEKIFYPPEKLNTDGTPLANGPAGILTYYEPWGNVAIFYGECRGASGLYELGEVTSGMEYISEMRGEIRVEKMEEMEQGIEVADKKLNIQIGTTTFTATLEINSSVDALLEVLTEQPLTISMNDYGGFEKVGAIGVTLPTNNTQMTTNTGDIVLYNGNQLVIFYGSNSWSYTKLATIDDISELEEALGNGDVTVTFAIDK